VDVFINDQLVTKVRSSEDPVVLDVTRFVNAGGNRVRMVATKRLESGRVSHSPTDSLEVQLGEGTQNGRTVTVNRVLATFRRDASETTSIREDFTFSVGN
jgi:hypothetical protein